MVRLLDECQILVLPKCCRNLTQSLNYTLTSHLGISEEKPTGSEPMMTDDLSEGQISFSEVAGNKYEVMDELSSVNSEIVELSTSSISSLVDENHTQSEIEGLQGIINSGNIMMIPVSNASNIMAQGGQKLVQIVNINGTPTLQVVNSETQLSPAGKY